MQVVNPFNRRYTPVMALEFKDYYKVLGVPNTATPDDIKKAFRSLARKYHPDVAKDKKSAEEKFKEINEANEVLSNPESHAKYDQLGANWKTGGQPRPQPGRAGRPGSRTAGAGRQEDYDFQFEGTGFSDFFEQFFGGRAGRAGGGPGTRFGGSFPGHDGFAEEDDTPRVSRGQDIHGDILITIDEVLKGAMRAISVRRPNPKTGVEENNTYQVRIPMGVRDGQSIRVAGKGGEGIGGGTAGDIFLTVRYAQNPDWDIQGSDLHGALLLSPWEAVLGATVPVRTPDGSVKVKVAPGTQAGNKLRVRGKGLPSGPTERGDLYVTVSIQLPPKPAQEEAELWKKLSELSTFDPRNPIVTDGV